MPTDQATTVILNLPRIKRAGGGRCLRCGVDMFVDGEASTAHSTWDSSNSACFPLCEACWAGLTPKQRMVYYELLMAWWEEDGSKFDAEAVRSAVMEGR